MTRTAIAPRAALRTAIAAARLPVERKNTIPILCNVALRSTPNGLTVTGTDLDMTVTALVPGAAIDGDFGTTIPAHHLADIEKRAPATDQVAIDIGEAYTSLDFEGLRVDLQHIDIQDFPDLAFSGPVKADFTLSTETLLDVLQRCSFAISTEATRYYLNGVYVHTPVIDGVQKLRFVATDGHRLALHDVDAPEGLGDTPLGVIIPSRTIATLIKIAKAKDAAETTRVIVNTNKVRVVVGNIDIVTKLVDGTFPDYQRCMPSNSTVFATVDSKALAKALEAVSVVKNGGTGSGVRFYFADGALLLQTKNPEMGNAQMSVPCDLRNASDDPEAGPPEVEIGFNYSYVLHALAAIGAERVTFSLGDSAYPALITAEDETGLRVVQMPMRI